MTAYGANHGEEHLRHRRVKLGMAAIEKLDRLRAGKARIAERLAS